MSQLVETIYLFNNFINNIEYHNRRFNETRNELFGCRDYIDLSKYINNGMYKNRPVKCRIIYDRAIQNIIYEPYNRRKIKTLKTVFDDEISYPYKFTERSNINRLLDKKENCDDVIIIKNDIVTDTSFTNIAFFTGKEWKTPAEPLLRGTARNLMIDKNMIVKDDIFYKDIKYFKKCMLINAMLLYPIFIDIEAIF